MKRQGDEVCGKRRARATRLRPAPDRPYSTWCRRGGWGHWLDSVAAPNHMLDLTYWWGACRSLYPCFPKASLRFLEN